MAVTAETSEDGDGIIRCTLPNGPREGTDLNKVLATHPGDEVEQMHAHVKDDTTLCDVLAPRCPCSQTGGALQGKRDEPSEPPGTYDLTRPPHSRIEPDLVGDAQEHTSIAAGATISRACATLMANGFHTARASHAPRRARRHDAARSGERVDRIDVGVMHQRSRSSCDALHAKALANARPLARELPRQAASREPGLLTMPGATKSVATQRDQRDPSVPGTMRYSCSSLLLHA